MHVKKYSALLYYRSKLLFIKTNNIWLRPQLGNSSSSVTYIFKSLMRDAVITLKEETFASGKICEIFGRNFREFRELANFGFFARIIFREFML